MSTPQVVLGTFLRARRGALLPGDVGLAEAVDSRRRVGGLRREEVATIAGISPEYYLRLEQAKAHNPSPQVLLALGRALVLDADATAYMFRLVGQSPPQSASALAGTVAASAGERDDSDEAASGLAALVMQWTTAPAYVSDRVQEVVAVNDMAQALVPFPLTPGVNLVEAVVRGAIAAGTERSEHWEQMVRRVTAALRYHSDPDDPRLQLLVASLSASSRVFRSTWASHEARPQRGGDLLALVEPFGYVTFRWQTLEVPGGEYFLTTMFGEAGSPASAAIDYLSARSRLARALDADADADAGRLGRSGRLSG
ncbi:helix-turn-helix transcriptional regulator [Gordonia jinhuaensis]|uniref:Transcriptional regulator n=1 Tax=Gordonia jinhuaensis TaxID=1517702 RepID=A0A916T4L2_9ACTN|nr:helix-turn-helix domain-containing protein [Gordonia jinhuaensis]GGB31186.1 transcriptional regulator [Gordonia jinhuaensis]